MFPSPSSIIWYQPMGADACGWEGNCRSGVAPATRQTLVVLHLRAKGLEEEDEHPPTLSCGSWSTIPYLHDVWLGGSSAGLAINRSPVQLPVATLLGATLEKLFRHIHAAVTKQCLNHSVNDSFLFA